MGPETITPGDGAADGQTSELAAPFFYHVSPDPLPYGWEPSGIYLRADHGILGDRDDTAESDTLENLQDTSQCFNCGNPEHKVPDCPFRLDRDLIALSRQYYLFFQGTLGLAKFQRIHAVETSRQERLNWLEEFEPGKIQGALLKEALESSNEEWLRNISLWGYPPGWISENHPRERIRTRIWEENSGDVADDLDDDSFFEIHGDGHVVETVSFQGAFQATDPSSINAGNTSPHIRSDTSSPCSTPSSHDSESERPQAFQSPQPMRWANYPPSYFSSHHLIPYIPPRRNVEPWSSTIFADTEAYLYQFHPKPPPPPEDEPPPLPPSKAPPPLPITSFPPSPPPPPSPPLLQQGAHSYPPPSSECSQIDTSDSDMELSDSE